MKAVIPAILFFLLIVLILTFVDPIIAVVLVGIAFVISVIITLYSTL